MATADDSVAAAGAARGIVVPADRLVAPVGTVAPAPAPSSSPGAAEPVAVPVPLLPAVDVQLALLLKGFDPGPVDGVVGPLTVQALSAFQSDAGLPVTGVVDGVSAGMLAAALSSVPTLVTVDLSEQHVYVHGDDGDLIGRWPVSTGKAGRETRVGVFEVTTRTRVGTSGSNPNVHMDWFTRFDRGIGFHGIPWKSVRANRIATPLGVAPASHGCVRMRDEHARFLFERLGDDAVVEVRP